MISKEVINCRICIAAIVACFSSCHVVSTGALSPNNSSNSNADSTFISLVNTLHNQQHHQQRTSCESPTSFCSPNIGLSLTSGSSNDSNFSDSLLITGPQGSAANDHRKLLQPQTSQSIVRVKKFFIERYITMSLFMKKPPSRGTSGC